MNQIQMVNNMARSTTSHYLTRMIKQSMKVTALHLFVTHDERSKQCSCKVIRGRKCSDNLTCRNRRNCIECPASCGAECLNQMLRRNLFQTNLVHVQSQGRDMGVVTMQVIEMNAFVLVFEGNVFVRNVNPHLNVCLHSCGRKRSSTTSHGRQLIVEVPDTAGLVRYIRHSHAPNLNLFTFCASDGSLRNVLIAVKKIEAGSELLVNYGEDHWKGVGRKCYCEAATCPNKLGYILTVTDKSPTLPLSTSLKVTPVSSLELIRANYENMSEAADDDTNIVSSNDGRINHWPHAQSMPIPGSQAKTEIESSPPIPRNHEDHTYCRYEFPPTTVPGDDEIYDTVFLVPDSFSTAVEENTIEKGDDYEIMKSQRNALHVSPLASPPKGNTSNAISTKSSSFSVHDEEHPSQPLQGLSLQNKKKMGRPKSDHSKMYCKEHDRQFKHKGDYNKHMHTPHARGQLKNSNKYCPIKKCTFSCVLNTDMYRHADTHRSREHRKVIHCPDCGNIFTRKSSLNVHMSTACKRP